jgi:hypothetical protein
VDECSGKRERGRKPRTGGSVRGQRERVETASKRETLIRDRDDTRHETRDTRDGVLIMREERHDTLALIALIRSGIPTNHL